MEKYLNLWDLEKIARQYVGFNEHLIKEYHALFKVCCDERICVNPTKQNNFRIIVVLQWRTSSYDKKHPYIYNFKPFIRPSDKRTLKDDEIVSVPAMLFKENVYRASVLK